MFGLQGAKCWDAAVRLSITALSTLGIWMAIAEVMLRSNSMSRVYGLV